MFALLIPTPTAMLSAPYGTMMQLLVVNVFNACKLSISGEVQLVDATPILRSSSSDPTPSTTSLDKPNNASTLFHATLLPGTTDTTTATIVQIPPELCTATSVLSVLESAQDVKITSSLTIQYHLLNAIKTLTAGLVTIHGLKSAIFLRITGSLTLMDALLATMVSETAQLASITCSSFKMTTEL
jgi:hypothetical protein